MSQILLVPVDGSEPALRALTWAIEQSKDRVDARIAVINVQNLALLDLGDAAAIMPPGWEMTAMEAASKKVLDEAVAHARRHGSEVIAKGARGAVGEAIVSFCQDIGASQIIMGTRGLGGVRGLLTGSVAFHVVHLSHVPVTLVK